MRKSSFAGYGAVPSFLNYEGYPASICASVDSQVVHGIPNESTVLREGQIISIDSGPDPGWVAVRQRLYGRCRYSQPRGSAPD